MRVINRYGQWRRRARARRLIATGNAARAGKRWSVAAEAYAEALRLDQTLAPIHVQYGHALKETGHREAALDAYDRALAIDPQNWDTWFHRGQVLKTLGRAEESILAFRKALTRIPDAAPIRSELGLMGANTATPDEAVEAVRTLDRVVDEARDLVNRAHRSYHDFRRTYQILPPPATQGAQDPGTMLVLVEARAANAAAIRRTMDSLVDQSCPLWRATIVTTAALAEHSVASMAVTDRRFDFADVPVDIGPGQGCLRLSAGTMLDPRALDWFRFAAARTSAAALYCDHDHAIREWRRDMRHFNPVLQPRFDPFWFDGSQSSPAAIYVAGGGAELFEAERSNAAILIALAADGGRIAHVPRLLASIVRTDALSASSPDGAPGERDAGAPGASERGGPGETTSIAVVIATRDQAALLERCIDTLVEQALFPGRLRITVVDNRSTETATAVLLKRLARAGTITVRPLDEPFNWSRANNVAIVGTDARHLLLLNNDTEMATRGWDVILSRYLDRPDVGLVGARLLYPDRTVQHAGILFGMNDGSPVHEGVGAAESAPGPQGRWARRRCAAAVTGAFMGMRRATWETLGGFDEKALPVAFNDIDMCLKARAAGTRVVFAADITVIHHESKTRGRNVTPDQVEWDLAELRTVHDRWGERLFDDPSLNPHWTRHGPAFSGYREPTTAEIVRYLDADG